MGAIKSFIEAAKSTSDTLVQEENAHLETLADLAQAKADLFLENINTRLLNAGLGADKTVPIGQTLESTTETHAYSSSSSKALSSAITASLGDFVHGGTASILDGVGKLITTAVTALFGDSDGADATIDKYYLADENGTLIRLDLLGWKRRLSGTSLTTRIEQVSAFAMVKSTVDMDKCQFGVFQDVFEPAVKAANPALTGDEVAKQLRDLFKSFQTSH